MALGAFSSTFSVGDSQRKKLEPMHLSADTVLSDMPSVGTMHLAVGNATSRCDYTLELVPIRFTRMIERTGDFISIGDVNATMTPTCILGSMVVLLQMTLVLRGIVMSREVRPFVVDHIRSVSKDYLRLTPLWYVGPAVE